MEFNSGFKGLIILSGSVEFLVVTLTVCSQQLCALLHIQGLQLLTFLPHIWDVRKQSSDTSLKYNQHDATFSRSTYFYKLLYMFQAVPPPIIRSTKLYIQRQALSNQYCCLLLSAAGSSIGLTIPDTVCIVLCS